MSSKKRYFDDSSIADDAERKRPAAPDPPSFNSNNGNEIVCFGMITGVTGSAVLAPKTFSFPVCLEAADCFVSSTVPAFRGRIGPEFTFLTGDLLNENDLELEITASSIDDRTANSKGAAIRLQGSSKPCRLSIVIYGPPSLFDDIGFYFQDYDIYLQDPIGCCRNVRYCNPHRLPSIDPSAHLFTFDLAIPTAAASTMEDLASRPELLDILDSQEDLAEAPQPPSIKTSLAKLVTPTFCSGWIPDLINH